MMTTIATASLVLASWLVPVAEAPAANPAPIVSLTEDLVVERLGEDLWLYRAISEINGRPVESNGLVVGDRQAAVLIDTPWDDESTAVLLDWMEAEVGTVTAVVATHYHADRLGGIAEVHRRSLPSYGHARTAALAIENGLEPPRVTFQEELVLRIGSQPIEVYFPGPGHTADNTVVWLPRHSLLFGGCLLKAEGWSGLGFIGDAVLDSWAGSLEALLARYPEARRVVPGHGESGDLGVVRHTRELVLQHLAREGVGGSEPPRPDNAARVPAERLARGWCRGA